MEQFRKLTKEELKNNIWKGKDFPEIIYLSSKWMINKTNWFGYFKDNKLIGICHLKYRKNYLYLHLLEIHKDYQNKGYGKEIIKNLIRISQKLRYNIIKVNPRDYRCYGFYTKCGFKQIFDKNWQLEI